MADPEIFEQYEVASFTVGGLPTITFAVTSITEEGANRIVERDRPYRDGAKLDDVGSKARRWSICACFNNTLTEPGLVQPVYPRDLNNLTRLFDEHETGDLVVPTVGKVRARAQRYVRHEEDMSRDVAKLDLTFVEDNEDSVGARAFNPPTVRASYNVLVRQAMFSAAADGVYSASLGDLNEKASQLSKLANTPANTIQDVDEQAGIVVAAVDRVTTSFLDTDDNARKQLSDPDASLTHRKLIAMRSTARRAHKELSPVGIVSSVVETATTLFDFAVRTGIDIGTLLYLNPGINPFDVPAGTGVRTYGAKGA